MCNVLRVASEHNICDFTRPLHICLDIHSIIVISCSVRISRFMIITSRDELESSVNLFVFAGTQSHGLDEHAWHSPGAGS